MDDTTIWHIYIHIGLKFEKREGRNGGRETVERIPLRRRVMDDTTVGDTLLELLYRPLFGLRRLVHDRIAVLQQPHRMRPNGGTERKNDNESKQGVVPVDITIMHTSIGIRDVCQ